MMSLALDTRIEIKIKLKVESEWFETIFPKTEKMLNSTRMQKALALLDDGGEMESYRSMMDFLACKTFTWLQPHCIAFYEGREKQLRFYMKVETIKAYDLFLSQIILPAALEGVKRKEMGTWEEATLIAREIFPDEGEIAREGVIINQEGRWN